MTITNSDSKFDLFSYVSSLVLFLYPLPELRLISWNLNPVK